VRDDSTLRPLTSASQAPPPTELAFVVQLRRTPAPSGEDLIGRVEHIACGETLRFDSAAELITFISKVGSSSR
jgi:hypothetical protein